MKAWRSCGNARWLVLDAGHGSVPDHRLGVELVWNGAPISIESYRYTIYMIKGHSFNEFRSLVTIHTAKAIEVE